MKNNAEVIKGIEQVIAGFEIIKNALAVEETNGTVAPVEETPKAKTGVKKVEKAPFSQNNVEAEDEEEAVVGNYTKEQLNSMKYNEFKKVAAALGVKCTGTRDEIMERILALNDEESTVEEVEEVEEAPAKKEAPAKSDKPTGGKKLSKTKAVEPAKDEFDEQAEEVAKNTSLEDIIEALEDVGVEANKKNAVKQLAFALREGLIELDEDEEAPTESVEEAKDGEINADSYFVELDPKGYNTPSIMSEERAKAVIDKMNEILTAYSEGELTDEDISSYVEDNATQEEIELLGGDYDEDDILKLYMELIKRTIDNEGEEHEPGDPYEVADKDVCCGHELKYSKKTKQYICEHCGTEYEAGE